MVHQTSGIPLPPPELLYQVSRDSDQGNFLRSSLGEVSALMQNLSDCDLDFAQPLRFLDFGCGVGKVLIGLREFKQLELHGCDLDENLIAWCSANLNASCYQNNLQPPLRYSDNYFDVINAISVFTHLNLEMQFRWAWELFRVLKPGGYLHFTVHGPAYFGLFAHVAKTRAITDLKIHSFDDSEFFMELEQPINEQLYKRKKAETAQGQLEVAVAHTPMVVEKIFSPFSLEKRIREGSIGSGHDVYVLRKPIVDTQVMMLSPFETLEIVSDKSGTAWAIRFDISEIGSSKGKRFRIFCTGSAPGTYLTEVGSVVRIKNNGLLVAEERPMLSKGTRFYGDTRWSIVEVSLPPALSGKIDIEIESIPKNSSYLQSVKWIAPQIL